jgi:hypothetical protein
MMTPSFLDPFVRSYQESPVNDLIVFTNHAADKGDTHVAFQGTVSDYVTLPPKLREFANALGVARDAASGHDENRLAEQKALMEAAVKALDHNSYHIALFSAHHKDPNILLNAGYELKPPKTSKGKINLLDLIPGLNAKHLEGVAGALNIILKRAKNNAIVELQITETPDDEASWKRASEGLYNKSRFELRGCEPTRRLYLRARYHEGGGVGAWCPAVSIIVL